MLPSRLRNSFAIWLILSTGLLAGAAEVTRIAEVPYKTGAPLTGYEVERCKLDWYLPAGNRDFPTLVWLYGGGLTGGARRDAENIGRQLAAQGVAVAVPDYRLSPRATYPAYIDDAAAAVAWVRAHVAEHGGRPDAVFLGGHSAGGYLTLMVGLDPQYLRRYGLSPADIRGLIPVSGQTLTHYTVREERGLDKSVAIVDAAAPLHFVHQGVPPLLVAWAANDLPTRGEENLLLVAALKAAGQTQIQTVVVPDRDHGTIVERFGTDGDPLLPAVVAFIRGDAR